MDNAVIARLKQGDKQAADELVHIMERDLRYMVNRYAPKQAEYDDMINTGYEIILSAALDFDLNANIDFRNYACMKLKNGFTNLKKRYALEMAHIAYSLDDKATDDEGDSLDDRGPPGTSRFEDEAVDRLMLRQAICSLPEKDAELIRMYFYDDMMLSEIAVAMNISVSMTKKRIYRGIKNLRKSADLD